MKAEHTPSLADLAIALAAGFAMFTYAGGLADPAAAAETHFLAVWATLVLVAMAGLAVPPAWDLAVTAVLTTLVVWAVPHGPTRGAAVGLLLTVALAVLTLRHLEKLEGRISWLWAVAAALGLQLLSRADRYLDLQAEPRILIGVAALPIACASALMLLSRREGALPVVLAAATVAMLVPAWSVTVTLSLLSIAAGHLWRHEASPRWVVALAAALLLLAAVWWQPALAWLLLLSLLAAGLRSSWKTGAVAIGVTAILLVFLPAARPWTEALRLLSLGPLLLPALLLPADNRRIDVAQGLLLALLALRTLTGLEALAAPLALVALSSRPKGVVGHLQMMWSGTLLIGAALLAGYPWLRFEPLPDVLRLFGLRIAWPSAVAVVALVWILGFLCAAIEERRQGLRFPSVAIGLVVLAIAAWFSLPSPAEQPLGAQPRVLDVANPEVKVDLAPPVPTRSVVVDTFLDNSTSLVAGTPVGRMVVVGSDGERQGWLLRAGYETGEWAARRQDVSNLPGFVAPPHWLAWVSPDGKLFAQRYRARWQLAEPIQIVEIRLERTDDLPDEVSLALSHLELRR